MGGRLYTKDLTTHHYKDMGGRLYTKDLTTQYNKGMESRLYTNGLQTVSRSLALVSRNIIREQTTFHAFALVSIKSFVHRRHPISL
jgi:hypothetical protein